MNKKFVIPLAALVAFGLAGCHDSSYDTVSWPSSVSETSQSADTHEKYDGIQNYQGATSTEKAEMLGALEGYGMKKHLCGIPMFDDGGYVEISSRLTLPTKSYITNYGFGTNNGTIDPDGIMYDKTIDEAKDDWKPYFHSYTTSADSGTVNYWNASGQDVADHYSLIEAQLFDVTMNDAKTGYKWRGVLSDEDRPIPCEVDSNYAFKNDVSGGYTAGALYSSWRIPVRTGLTYSTLSTVYAGYNGRTINLEDYLTPVKAMCGLYGGAKLKRGTDIGSTSSGFAGVNSFSPANPSNAPAAYDWATSGVGYQIDADNNSIIVTYATPKTQFNAMYDVSDPLFSPVPESFISDLGGGGETAASFKTGIGLYGQVGAQSDKEQAGCNVLSTGMYDISYWEKDKEMVFKKNPNFYYQSEINFPGMTEVVIIGTDSTTTAYEDYLANQLDYVTIPNSYVSAHKSDANSLHTPGSTTNKINVNSCTSDEWNYYFGADGTIYPHTATSAWDVKPIMSDDDFLDGVYFSIDREALAEKTGHNSSLGYLSDAYMVDPESGVSYRDTDAGKAALSEYTAVNAYGHSDSMAQQLFYKAMSRAVANEEYEPGSIAEPTTITLTYWFRVEATIKSIGDDIKSDIEDNFNSACPGFKLVIDEETAGSSYVDCYTKMQDGDYDFGDGAISGSALDPLSFMSTLSTDSLSQGFCLNWGERTDEVSTYDPVIYDGKSWAYDALYTAANGTAVVSDGLNVPVFTDVGYDGTTDDDNVLVTENYHDVKADGKSIWTLGASSVTLYGADSDFSNYEAVSLDDFLPDGAEGSENYITYSRDESAATFTLSISKNLLADKLQGVADDLGISISALEIDYTLSYTYTNDNGVAVTSTYSSAFDVSDLTTIGLAATYGSTSSTSSSSASAFVPAQISTFSYAQ